MRLPSLDLNLLLPLHALLEERHVTNAGLRIGLSQSAMSDALRRLRRYFDDELLVRVGSSYELTPLALILRERASEAIEKIESTFASRSTFDASISSRTFSIYTSGYGSLIFIRPFLDDIRGAGIDLRLRVLDIDGIDLDALRNCDGVLTPREFAGNYPSTAVFTDEWVVISARGRDSSMTLEELTTRPWVIIWDAAEPYSPAVKRLHALGVAPKVDIVVEDFLSTPHMVAGSDRIAIVPRRLARTYASLVESHNCPFPTPALIETFWWHSAHTADPGHVWFRRLIEETSKRMADHDLSTNDE